jgi:hypothetical protein
MRLTPRVVGCSAACASIWLVRATVLLLDWILMMSVAKSWTALAARMSGFPNRNAHPPLLSKTSNLPLNVMLPSTIAHFYMASEGTIVPLAICNHLLEGPHPDNLCLIIRKTVEHMAPTIAPLSNSALTHTISSCGPFSCSVCLIGTSSLPSFHCW